MASIHRKALASSSPRSKSHAVMSCDGDLILQILSALPSNIDIINNSPSVDKKSGFVFSKKAFLSYLEEEFPSCSGSLVGVVNDFLFLSLFCGNDYLPSVAFASIKTTWPFYVLFQRKKHFPSIFLL